MGRRSHQRLRDFDCNFQTHLCIKRTVPSYESLQSFAIDQLHCVVAVSAIVRSAEVVNSGNVWMPQRGRGAGFT